MHNPPPRAPYSHKERRGEHRPPFERLDQIIRAYYVHLNKAPEFRAALADLFANPDVATFYSSTPALRLPLPLLETWSQQLPSGVNAGAFGALVGHGLARAPGLVAVRDFLDRWPLPRIAAEEDLRFSFRGREAWRGALVHGAQSWVVPARGITDVGVRLDGSADEDPLTVTWRPARLLPNMPLPVSYDPLTDTRDELDRRIAELCTDITTSIKQQAAVADRQVEDAGWTYMKRLPADATDARGIARWIYHWAFDCWSHGTIACESKRPTTKSTVSSCVNKYCKELGISRRQGVAIRSRTPRAAR